MSIRLRKPTWNPFPQATRRRGSWGRRTKMKTSPTYTKIPTHEPAGTSWNKGKSGRGQRPLPLSTIMERGQLADRRLARSREDDPFVGDLERIVGNGDQPPSNTQEAAN